MVMKALSGKGVSGGSVWVNTATLTGDNQQIDCGFQPDYVILITSDFVYTYDKDERASDTFVGQNLAWASTGRKGGYYSGNVVPNANGFAFTPIASTEVGKIAKIVATKE